MGSVLIPTGGANKNNLLNYLTAKNFKLSEEDLEGCVQIGDYVFYNNTYLTKIEIPYGIMKIGDYAFYGCTNLTEVHIPGSVSSIGEHAFEGCTNLQTIYYGGLASGWNALSKGTDWNANTLNYTISYAEADTTHVVGMGYDSTLGGYSINFRGSTDTDVVVIPDTYDGYPVVQISSYYTSSNKSFSGVVIPPSVKKISGNAFRGFNNLTSLTIPNSVETIETQSYKPTGTQYVSIAGSNSAIGKLYGDYTVNFFSTLADANAKVGVPGNYEISVNTNTDTFNASDIVNDVHFQSSSHATKIVVPDNIVSITRSGEGSAFWYADYVELPDTIASSADVNLGPYSTETTIKCSMSVYRIIFSSWSMSSNLNLIVTCDDNNDSLIQVKSYPSILSIEFDNSIKNINKLPTRTPAKIKFNGTQKEWFERDNYPNYYGTYSFTNLTLYDGDVAGGFVINSNVTKICTGSLGNIALTSITIPEDIEYVWSLGDTTNLSYNTYNNGKYVGNSSNPYLVFIGPVSSVSSLTLHSDCKHIGANAFKYNYQSISVYLPSGIISIGTEAFATGSSYRVTLYDNTGNVYDLTGLKYLGSGSMCSLPFRDINLPRTMDSVYGGTFYYMTVGRTMSIPSNIIKMGREAVACCTDYYYEGNEEQWANIDYSLSGGVPGGYPTGSSYQDTSLTVPFKKYYNLYVNDNELLVDLDFNNPDVKINDYGFCLCNSLKSVNITSDVGEHTFMLCKNLTDVTLNEGITSIGEDAFDGCTNLVNVSIPSTLAHISYPIFGACPNLVYNIYDNANYLGNSDAAGVLLMSATSTSISSCIISSSCKAIKAQAFQNCASLTSISVPSGVKSILPYTFGSCTGMTTVDIPNSMEELWCGAFQYCSNLTSINYSGTKSQWLAISKNVKNSYVDTTQYGEWDYNTGEYTIHCTDGDLTKSEGRK